jgi:hypothetical protein
MIRRMKKELCPAAGRVPARVDRARERDSRAGKPMVVLDLSVQVRGRAYEVAVFVPLHVEFRVAELFEAFGIVSESFEAADLVGREVLVTVEHEDYEGETQARVTRLERPEVRRRATAKSASRAEAAEPEDDDDVPF